ncbi:hypothetical protein ACNKHS_07735 [Shigella flexneri]
MILKTIQKSQAGCNSLAGLAKEAACRMVSERGDGFLVMKRSEAFSALMTIWSAIAFTGW